MSSIKKRFSASMALAMLLVFAGFAVMTYRSPARAEETLGETDFRFYYGHYKYNVFLYPNLSQAFWLPDGYETRFDIHNGKFWLLEYHEGNGPERAPLQRTLQVNTPKAVTLRFDLSFYTPRGEEIATYKGIVPNWWRAIPVNRTSLEYDRLQIRVRNHSSYSRDIRFVVMDPIDPVKGTPIPNPREIHL